MMPDSVVSIVIPTLNSANVLDACLSSIKNQKYPGKKIEIIVADGGSTDSTRIIADKYGAKFVDNIYKTGEAGKAAGIKVAKGEFAAFIDSDNILPDAGWISRMLLPFSDPDIILSEPIRYTYRKDGGIIERYSALLGMNDPLCLFLGNYDRECLLTGTWTEIPHHSEKKNGYLKVVFRSLPLPTIGANGTLFRMSTLKRFSERRFLFDIDIVSEIMRSNGSVVLAKVDTGIIHTFCEGSVIKFIRKQKRRITDYVYYSRKKLRSYQWTQETRGLFKFVVCCILVIPLVYQCILGFSRKRDAAWFLHPVLCILTFLIYSWYVVISRAGLSGMHIDRNHWRQ